MTPPFLGLRKMCFFSLTEFVALDCEKGLKKENGMSKLCHNLHILKVKSFWYINDISLENWFPLFAVHLQFIHLLFLLHQKYQLIFLSFCSPQSLPVSSTLLLL